MSESNYRVTTVTELISAVQGAIEFAVGPNLACDHFLGKKTSCLEKQVEGYGRLLSDRKFYAMCSACRTYYLLLMARNALVEHARTR